jgi:hypothetical protein
MDRGMITVRLLDQELDEQPQVNEERIDRCARRPTGKAASSTYRGSSAITFSECPTCFARCLVNGTSVTARGYRRGARQTRDGVQAFPSVKRRGGTAGEQTISLNLSQPADQPYPAHPQRY